MSSKSNNNSTVTDAGASSQASSQAVSPVEASAEESQEKTLSQDAASLAGNVGENEGSATAERAPEDEATAATKFPKAPDDGEMAEELVDRQAKHLIELLKTTLGDIAKDPEQMQALIDAVQNSKQ